MAVSVIVSIDTPPSAPPQPIERIRARAAAPAVRFVEGLWRVIELFVVPGQPGVTGPLEDSFPCTPPARSERSPPARTIRAGRLRRRPPGSGGPLRRAA